MKCCHTNSITNKIFVIYSYDIKDDEVGYNRILYQVLNVISVTTFESVSESFISL